MNWHWRLAASPKQVYCLALLTAAAAAFAADEPVTEPEACLFLGMPYRLAYLEAENRVLMTNGGGAYSLDAASGQEIWHRYLGAYRTGCGIAFGTHKTMGWSESGVFLLDITTGKELWFRNDPQCGEIRSAQLSPDETHVLVEGTRGCLLYTPSTHSKVALPKPENAWCLGWLPGNETLLFEKDDNVADKTIRKWLLMDASTGKMDTGWEEELTDDHTFRLLSSTGLLSEATPDENEDTTTLRILDAPTGKAVHEFKGLAGQTRLMFWFRDGKRLYYTYTANKQATILDSETGTAVLSFSLEGHRFEREPYEDAAGNAWIFSRDAANTVYVWPMVAGGTPRKVLDGARIAPGSCNFSDFNRDTYVARTIVEDLLWSYTLYSLNDSRKIGEWLCRRPKNRWADFFMNREMTHCVQFSPTSEKNENWRWDMMYTVCVQNNPEPVGKGEGRPMAVSPDGTYLMAQTGNDAACLLDVASARVLREFTVTLPEEQKRYGAYMNAEFSRDGSLAVINTKQSLEVVSLAEGYPKWSMSLSKDELSWIKPSISPDATRILGGGNNHALLFDANSGDLLHTFEETERYARLYAGGEGFWSNLARSAEDWVGTLTDRLKPGSYVQADFTDDGKHVITYSMGQVIRVWDAESGELVRTLHTGLPEKRNRYGEINNEIVLSPNNRFAFAFNRNQYGLASLWSLDDGTLLRQYQLPQRETTWMQAAVLDDGSAIFLKQSENFYRWPGKKQP